MRVDRTLSRSVRVWPARLLGMAVERLRDDLLFNRVPPPQKKKFKFYNNSWEIENSYRTSRVGTQPSQLLRCTTIPPLENSDHYGIYTALKWRVKKVISNSRLIWRYKYADFEKACFLLDTIDWDIVLPNDVSNAWLTWQTIFLQIMEECVPRVVLRARHNLPWLDKRIVQAMKCRNRLYKICKRITTCQSS